MGPRLVLPPELSICGHATENLFLRPAFVSASDDAVNLLARELAGLNGLTMVVGHPTRRDSRSKSPGTRGTAAQHGKRDP